MNGGDEAPVPLIDVSLEKLLVQFMIFHKLIIHQYQVVKQLTYQVQQSSAPTALTLTDELVQYNDGTVIVKLVIDFTAPTDNFTEIFEVEVKQDNRCRW